MKVQEFIDRYYACTKGYLWLRSLGDPKRVEMSTAWRKCKRPDWLMWAAMHAVDHDKRKMQKLALVYIGIAREVVHTKLMENEVYGLNLMAWQLKTRRDVAALEKKTEQDATLDGYGVLDLNCACEWYESADYMEVAISCGDIMLTDTKKGIALGLCKKLIKNPFDKVPGQSNKSN